MKGADSAIILKLVLDGERPWTIRDVAAALFLSASEVHGAFGRLTACRIFDAATRRVRRQAAEEYLIHGLKYDSPAEPGRRGRGIPTAHAMSPLAELILADPVDAVVWGWPTGEMRGQQIAPLYRTAPKAALADKRLYEFLALLDALRLGRPREQALATEILSRRIRTDAG